MNAFEQASQVERSGIDLLYPWLKYTHGNNIVFCDSKQMQDEYGDFVLQRGRAIEGIELKVERKHTGNLFLETWSNRHMQNRGWLFKSKSETLYYVFLDVPVIYGLNLQALSQWAQSQEFATYKEIQQKAYSQMNDTWGKVVKIEKLKQLADLRLRAFFYPQDKNKFLAEYADFPF